MIFQDLLRDIYTACEDKPDSRFNSWSKFVTKINPKGKDGYAFDGVWIKAGTHELDPETCPRLILVAVTNGSRNYQTTRYYVLIFGLDGSLTKTDITTDNKTPGWALRIRDKLITLNQSLTRPTETQIQTGGQDVW